MQQCRQESQNPPGVESDKGHKGQQKGPLQIYQQQKEDQGKYGSPDEQVRRWSGKGYGKS